MEEFERVRPPPIGIWQQKQCRNRPGWFSKSSHSYCKNDVKTTNFHHQNSLGKAASLMRLSSTGDTVEDIADFRNFDPSIIRGSESRPAGIFDRITKFAVSASNNITRGSSMSLTQRLPGKPVESRVDLNILNEKFDPSKIEMERPRIQNAWVVPMACPQPQLGMMNGFVKEGVYHPFQRRTDYPDRQPGMDAFSFLNVGPSNHQAHHYRNQVHPYQRWNHQLHVPNRHPLANSVSRHLDSISCNPLLASPGTPNSQRAKISDSTRFRDKFVDPKFQPQSHKGYTEAEGQDRGHINHVMKQQPMMSHRQNQNKSSGYVSAMPNPGNSNQLNNRTPNRCTLKNHNSCASSKSGKPTTVSSGCISSKSPEHQTLQQSDEKVIRNEQLVRPSDDNDDQPKQVLKVDDVKGRTELKANQAGELESNVASSVVDERWETNHHKTAEPDTNQQGTEAKSTDDKETSSTTQTRPCDENKNKQPCDSNINTTEEDKLRKVPQDKSSNDLSTNHNSTPSSKPLHESLAYILAETVCDDVSDSDWDVEDSPPDNCDFLNCWNDPYNPLNGWKCESYSTKQTTPEPVKHDSSLRDDELDSGIYSLQAQQDEADSVSDNEPESEEWIDQDSNISNSSEKCLTEQLNSLNLVSDETKQSLNKVQTQEVDDFDVAGRPSENSIENSSETDKSVSSKSSMLHPSVLFILGINETDSDDDDDDDDFDDFDNCSSDAKRDVSWDPIQRIHDPFNPLQGWKCTLATPQAKAHATPPPLTITCTIPDNLSTDIDSCQETTNSIEEARPRMPATTAPSTAVGKPTLKHAPSAGCLSNLSETLRSGLSSVVKKVHFCKGSPIFISPEIPMWMSEYCASRKGPWEEMARDRCRFMHRVRTTEGMIGHVFEPEHRERVQKRLEAC
ncbi:uncharacterized protein LOC117305272 [Asterias rubens]|uniref:uncharacterized protein LOC117305272 n=1 Tax=Asterias rubens TaxID=7604 RepID=UPI001454E758|nr:uncharacterized protein LOC117305272 [Asterias rubens]